MSFSHCFVVVGSALEQSSGLCKYFCSSLYVTVSVESLKVTLINLCNFLMWNIVTMFWCQQSVCFAGLWLVLSAFSQC